MMRGIRDAPMDIKNSRLFIGISIKHVSYRSDS